MMTHAHHLIAPWPSLLTQHLDLTPLIGSLLTQHLDHTQLRLTLSVSSPRLLIGCVSHHCQMKSSHPHFVADHPADCSADHQIRSSHRHSADHPADGSADHQIRCSHRHSADSSADHPHHHIRSSHCRCRPHPCRVPLQQLHFPSHLHSHVHVHVHFHLPPSSPPPHLSIPLLPLCLRLALLLCGLSPHHPLSLFCQRSVPRRLHLIRQLLWIHCHFHLL
mmetsp:Transcript_12621/g.20567  ORF Transcript_12621/g.20567 Transcript_12621/m.20567 type:complete len:220 (-) Transcript_12621:2241-2900(-)